MSFSEFPVTNTLQGLVKSHYINYMLSHIVDKTFLLLIILSKWVNNFNISIFAPTLFYTVSTLNIHLAV